MPFSGNCTPDRSKLFGSHGQRPWIYDVLKNKYYSFIAHGQAVGSVLPCGRRLHASVLACKH